MTEANSRNQVVSDQGFTELKLEGNPTILVVDDEELMREVTTIMIEENGGESIVAIDGLDAVEKFAENVDEIDCVLMDFSMPQMNGYEAYLEIKKIKPDVGVVMVSGLKMIPEVVELKNKGEIEFISKPFHEVEL
ncbi:MAG: response regulator, partial [Candidatus Dadabacteria bacterium]